MKFSLLSHLVEMLSGKILNKISSKTLIGSCYYEPILFYIFYVLGFGKIVTLLLFGGIMITKSWTDFPSAQTRIKILLNILQKGGDSKKKLKEHYRDVFLHLELATELFEKDSPLIDFYFLECRLGGKRFDITKFENEAERRIKGLPEKQEISKVHETPEVPEAPEVANVEIPAASTTSEVNTSPTIEQEKMFEKTLVHLFLYSSGIHQGNLTKELLERINKLVKFERRTFSKEQEPDIEKFAQDFVEWFEKNYFDEVLLDPDNDIPF